MRQGHLDRRQDPTATKAQRRARVEKIIDNVDIATDAATIALIGISGGAAVPAAAVEGVAKLGARMIIRVVKRLRSEVAKVNKRRAGVRLRMNCVAGVIPYPSLGDARRRGGASGTPVARRYAFPSRELLVVHSGSEAIELLGVMIVVLTAPAPAGAGGVPNDFRVHGVAALLLRPNPQAQVERKFRSPRPSEVWLGRAAIVGARLGVRGLFRGDVRGSSLFGMSVQTARNIGIVVLLGLVVWLVPGGGEGASVISQLLTAIFIVLMAVGCGILYRNFRGEIFSLGDAWRFALYAAVGTAIVTVAASGRLFDQGPAGALLWFALIGGASYTLYLVWRHHRSYS